MAAPPPYPNINAPGGIWPQRDTGEPGRSRRDRGHDDGDGKRHRRPDIIYYGVPYPYVIYTTEPGRSSDPSASSSYNYKPPLATADPVPAPADSYSAALPVTLLVFKDRTLILVNDYWLTGDQLWYETAPGVRASIPLDQLDLPLTQQLNRERGVPFTLQSR
jgi:hypothetical protein